MAMKKEKPRLFCSTCLVSQFSELKQEDLAWVGANLGAFLPTPLESIFKLLKVM